MDRNDWVVSALLPTAINDLLATPFDLWIASLHRVEVQGSRIGAHRHTRGGAAAHSNTKTGPAQLYQQGAGLNPFFLGTTFVNTSQATGNHDRLVVTPSRGTNRLFKRSKIAKQVWTTELIIKCGCA